MTPTPSNSESPYDRQNKSNMTAKELQQCEEEWRVAQKALKAAQKMPAGPRRFDALRKAGQMRFEADQRRRSLQKTLDDR